MLSDRPAELCATCADPIGPDMRCATCDEQTAGFRPPTKREAWLLADNPRWSQPTDPFDFPS